MGRVSNTGRLMRTQPQLTSRSRYYRYVLSHNLPPRGYAENPPEHTKHLRVDHTAWTKRRELEKARAERDSDGDGHFRHVYTDIQFQRDPYAVTDRLRKERKDAEAELYGDVTFEVDPDLDFKRRSNHSDLHHGNWDHEYHKVKRETDAELERAHPKVESPRQGIRYGRRRLPSHIRPNHNGGVI